MTIWFWANQKWLPCSKSAAAMVKAGFPARFGAGVITTSGALGILIPPSICMVMFSVASASSQISAPSGEVVVTAELGGQQTSEKRTLRPADELTSLELTVR